MKDESGSIVTSEKKLHEEHRCRYSSDQVKSEENKSHP